MLTNVPDNELPFPEAAMPVTFARLSLVQLKVVPATPFVVVNDTFEIAAPEQTD